MKRAKLSLENLAPLPERMTAFKQDRAKLVQERLARSHQTGADPVQGLQVEPILAFHLDETHRWSRRRFGDPGRIVVIVLLRADIRAVVFRRHQSHFMPVRGELATDMMRPAARLHGNGASRKFVCKIGKRRPPDASAQNDLPSLIQSNHAVQVLAQVNSKGQNSHRFAPSSLKQRHHSLVPAGGAGHSTKDPRRCLSRSRGGLGTKIHALTNQDGLPIRYELTPGQAHDAPPCKTLLDNLQPGQHVLADKAYDADWIRDMIWEQGAIDVIPPKVNRKLPAEFDPEIYRERNKIERYFGRLKSSLCRIATQYEKT